MSPGIGPPDRKSALTQAVFGGDFARAQALIDAGEDPNPLVWNGDGEMPLLTALLLWARPEAARFLLKNEASPNRGPLPAQESPVQPSPLMAAMERCPELMEELVWAGADLSAVNRFGHSLESIAESNGQGEAFREIMERKAIFEEQQRLGLVLEAPSVMPPRLPHRM